MQALTKTNFTFKGQKGVYHGKVRDVYNIKDEYMVMVVSDRISAFDVVLPKGIPYKGQVLNQIASKFLDATADIVPNWKIAKPDPMVTIGHFAEPFKVEMVIRGYLTGHAWREYRDGKRMLCGIPLEEGMRENQRFDSPVNISVHSIRRRLADPDGISAKAAIDGIVKAGILADDSHKEVCKVSYSQEKGKEEETIITITEV